MGAAELRPYFQGFVSVDEVKAYKPSPKAYRRVAETLGWQIGEIRLVSCNPFDDIGAEAARRRAAWVDRSGGQGVEQAPRPEMVVATLTELADAPEARAVR